VAIAYRKWLRLGVQTLFLVILILSMIHGVYLWWTDQPMGADSLILLLFGAWIIFVVIFKETRQLWRHWS
jgi:hypothetical protein